MPRPLKIHLRFDESQPVTGRALQRYLSTLAKAEIVSTIEEADLVITDSLKRVERDWDQSKPYALLSTNPNKTKLPENIRELDIINLTTTLLPLISELEGRLVDAESAEVTPKFVRPSAPAGAKRVLIVDDTPANIQSALETVPGQYELVTASGYTEAMEILDRERFDIVLTDLHMPMSSEILSEQAFKLGELIPNGLLIVMEALRNGVKKIAVVTDLSHHSDPFSAAFDHFSGKPIKVGDVEIRMLHASLRSDSAKDWGRYLD